MAILREILLKMGQDDVRRVLRPREAESLTLWSDAFFTAKLAKLIQKAAID